ncbi:hypothetical protein SODALDRAFT_352083 [Sodiomyces alkalinus F11]|uniref:Uncharacterized protein n=1 Tax=Sodiomyces alkalinus (strain CBS 110278 / VKM F-3762 / F11) TaxID=1314773 RepID=A0A3N2PR72_SODAK|nr:hypothetical protein SODALDRAFT_352083 [Sodiomyces alkalinus F11]ROT36846.1 hypothetical protein SODALDRAFT_352083 [Sodiomyces alkalinus F11]
MTDKPEWEVYFDTELGPGSDPGDDYVSAVAKHAAVGSLLRAPEDEDDALVAKRAAEQFRAFYTQYYHDEDRGYHRAPDNEVYGLTNDLTHLALSLVPIIPFADYKHRRLSMFVIDLKTLAPQEFDPKDPQLLFNATAVGDVVYPFWKRNYLSDPRPRKEYDEWISVSVFMARLFDAGILGKQEMNWMILDIAEGLETNGERTWDGLIRACKQVVATQYILIAGHFLASLARSSTKMGGYSLDADKWKRWAAKLKELATSASDEWGLREAAAAAHEKMIHLYPEAFVTS